jgi:uncharacterized membrane protein YjgN (DUF898 family)
MENKEYKKGLKFYGSHSTLVGLRILNNLLKVITLGIYYPWARAAEMKYMYGETEMQDTRFVFHGTGNELFKGFIKAILILICIYAIFFFCLLSKSTPLIVLGVVFIYVAFILITPVALHSSYRYRLSRSSWRGIHFGYRGQLGEFVKLFLGNILLTILTLGIYGSWMQVSLRKYMMAHMRFGNIEFSFNGRGLDLFLIHLKGIVLSIVTLGIYSFWYMKALAQFEFNNIKMIQDGKEIKFRTTITAGAIFKMIFVNMLIIIFTLGIATGVAINRAMRVALNNIEFDDDINANTLLQTEEEYKDATGDDIAGILDIPLF